MNVDPWHFRQRRRQRLQNQHPSLRATALILFCVFFWLWMAYKLNDFWESYGVATPNSSEGDKGKHFHMETEEDEQAHYEEHAGIFKRETKSAADQTVTVLNYLFGPNCSKIVPNPIMCLNKSSVDEHRYAVVNPRCQCLWKEDDPLFPLSTESGLILFCRLLDHGGVLQVVTRHDATTYRGCDHPEPEKEGSADDGINRKGIEVVQASEGTMTNATADDLWHLTMSIVIIYLL